MKLSIKYKYYKFNLILGPFTLFFNKLILITFLINIDTKNVFILFINKILNLKS